ncbi:MAG: hypothetical protein ACNA74_04900 [Desulfurivibrio sp.]
MPKSRMLLLLLLLAALLAGGCSKMLPVAKVRSEARWPSFAASKGVFDQIIPYQTTREDLRVLHIDPLTTPNIQILSYPEIMKMFMPNASFSVQEMDQGLRDCVADSANCMAYQLQLESMDSRRHGNFVLDLLGFVRQTHQIGWRFTSLLVMVDDVVVHKIYGGTPKVDEHLYRRNPFGPVQDPAEMVKDATILSIM